MKAILIIRVLVACALAACGGKQTSSPTVDNATSTGNATTGDKPGTGKEGDVCHLGREHVGSAVAVDCGPGLSCCYPCGIDGCDSVCMTSCPEGIP